MIFDDRVHAGRELALSLAACDFGDVRVIGLARGGLIVAAEVAKRFQVPLEVTVVRRIHHQDFPQVTIAAVAEGGNLVVDQSCSYQMNWLKGEYEREREETARQRMAYRGDRLYRSLLGKTALVVDDGLATGLTMQAALMHVRNCLPRQVVAAVPVASGSVAEKFRMAGHHLVAVDEPQGLPFFLKERYQNFPAVTDDEVIAALRAHDIVSV